MLKSSKMIRERRTDSWKRARKERRKKSRR